MTSACYRALFIAEVVGVTVATLMWWGYLVRRGRKVVLKESNHPEEVRRIAVFWGLVGITCVILYIMASFWPNQDGSWHQTAVRDTALTPAHIPMFFLFFPLGITFTVGTYLYGRYWLPKVYGAEKGFPWSFFFLIAASVTEMAQVAMNEWGHSLWDHRGDLRRPVPLAVRVLRLAGGRHLRSLGRDADPPAADRGRDRGRGRAARGRGRLGVARALPA